MILKNVASQGVYLFASNKTTGVGLAGDQANITGFISKDGAAEAAFATANPTNIGGGIYWQPFSQAESNCNSFGLRWASATTDILVDPLVGFTDQGRIDATITSRAPASTAMTNATWTDAKAAFLDAAITSRLAGSSYVAPTVPPTAVAIRTEIDSNSTKLDVAVSTRAPSATALNNGTWTDARAGKIDFLDVAVSSVSGGGGSITEGDIDAIATAVWTSADAPAGTSLTDIAVAVRDVNNTAPAVDSLGEAVNSGLGGTDISDFAAAVRIDMDTNSTKLANLDASISSRSPSATALSNVQWTNARATKIDFLDVAVSTRATAGGITQEDIDAIAAGVVSSIGDQQADSPGVTTLLARLTDTRATKMDNLDVAVSTRMATSTYTTPPTVGAIATQVDTTMASRFTGLSTYSGGPVASVTAPVTVGTNNDKDGYGLKAGGLDLITTTMNGIPTTFVQKLMWGFHEKWKAARSKETGVKTVYGSNGSAATVQATTNTETNQTIGAGTTP